jgi:hypothetical protein
LSPDPVSIGPNNCCWIWGQAKEVAIAKCNKETYVTFAFSLAKRKENMKASPMSEEFHDWLDKCPVIWFRGEVTRDHVTYSFETPNEEDEE